MPTPTTPSIVFSEKCFLRQKAAGDAAGPPVFRLSNGVLDRHKDRVRPDAISVEEFNPNPVLLWNHDDARPAIGTARVYREGDEWLMEPTFDGIGELSKEVGAKVNAGTLRSCSFKFIIDGYEPNAEGGLDYTAIRVVEASITNVPANQESIRLKNNTPPPPENAPPPPPPATKALEQADLDALSALLDAKLKPLLDACAAMAAKEAEKPETSKAEDPPSPAPAPNPEEADAKSFQRMLQGHRR